MADHPVSVGLVVGIAFALVAGVNDGAALLAVNLPNVGVRPIGSLLTLAGALVVVPLALGTGVAQTYAHGIVVFGGPDQAGDRLALALGVAAAVGVVLVLVRAGIATSLTVAVVGGILGSALGLGASVDWWAAARVIGFAVVALALSLVAGVFLATALAHLPSRRHAGEQLRVLGLLSFVGVAIAYGANDGQKMIAVLALMALVVVQVAGQEHRDLAAEHAAGGVDLLYREQRALVGGLPESGLLAGE